MLYAHQGASIKSKGAGGAGQERKLVPGAMHTSCTIEMANLGRRVDVAVIDEIQVHTRATPTLSSLIESQTKGAHPENLG